MTQPALLGGIAIGVLSGLPVIGIGNCCCGAWVLLGGGLAAYLLQQDRPAPITIGDGALVGLLAGVIGTIAWAVVAIPVNMMLAPFQQSLLQGMLSSTNDMPPEARSMLEAMMSRQGTIGIGAVFVIFVGMFVCGFWAMIGGLFGALMFKKNTPPPPPPVSGFEPPPPPPPFNPANFAPPPPPGG